MASKLVGAIYFNTEARCSYKLCRIEEDGTAVMEQVNFPKAVSRIPLAEIRSSPKWRKERSNGK